jgi:hypothetical protein
MTNKADGLTESAQNLTGKTTAIAAEASGWIAHNIVDILLAAAAGLVIALILLGLRSLGCKMMARWGSTDPHWPAIFGRVLAKTNLFFIVMCSAGLVAEHAATPPAILRIVEILFVIAAALQAAIWGRELVLGYVQHRAGIDDEHSTLASPASSPA